MFTPIPTAQPLSMEAQMLKSNKRYFFRNISTNKVSEFIPIKDVSKITGLSENDLLLKSLKDSNFPNYTKHKFSYQEFLCFEKEEIERWMFKHSIKKCI